MSQPEQNLILYDWLTFSTGFLRDEVLLFLGLDHVQWKTGLKTRLLYDERWEYEGISIHWSAPHSSNNSGCCVEMSGGGCRTFETFGGKCFPRLLYDLVEMGANITRLDIAYDDFTGVIDLDEMFRACNALEFKCTSKSFSTNLSATDREHFGKSVCHGARSSEVFFRCYDKRVERGAYDEFSHWVRFEIQLRKNAAMNFARLGGQIGHKFAAVINNYLAYLVPDPSDTNYRRWELAPWWSEFVASVDRVSLYSKKEQDYNLSRLESYVFGQCQNAIKTAITLIGYQAFLDRLPAQEDLPPKYSGLISEVTERRKTVREKAIEHELIGVRAAVSQGRRDEILKTICGGT